MALYSCRLEVYIDAQDEPQAHMELFDFMKKCGDALRGFRVLETAEVKKKL